MRILLVDNNTVHKNALSSALAGNEVEIQRYQPGVEFHYRDKDLVILSGGGGEGQEIADKHQKDQLWYEDEINFVRNADKPIIGICMGFEVICKAFGAEVEEMDSVVKGVKRIESTTQGQNILRSDTMHQLKAPKWRVRVAPQDFTLLAKSKTGVEVILHNEKPILGTQFHPEAPSGTFSLSAFQQILFQHR
jgi:anthranilate/para-aminobenzoate synthase component II